MSYKYNNLRTNFLLFLSMFVFILVFRYFPHPPNFTPVLALTLYTSIYFGLRSSPFVILAFALSDYFLGFHQLLIFTWGSLAIISIIGMFGKSFLSRLFLLFLKFFIIFQVLLKYFLNFIFLVLLLMKKMLCMFNDFL